MQRSHAGRGVATAADAAVELDRDVFLRTLIRHLSGALEDVMGLADASGFISLVGHTMGEEIGREYRRALGLDRLSRAQVAQVVVDLKRRIGGTFYVISESDERIVLGNGTCPFGNKVLGRSSMCMMTTNVLGKIAADNLGYAKVELKETIARGHDGCVVVIYLRPTDEAKAAEGREYFGIES